MSPKGCAANLVQASKNLTLEWKEATNYWRDKKSFEFEQEYLNDIPDHVARAASIMAEIEVLLRKVRSECE